MAYGKTINRSKRINAEIAKRFKSIRNVMGLTQKDCSLAMGRSQNYISLIENNKSILQTEDLFQLCITFKISSDYLMGISGIDSFGNY